MRNGYLCSSQAASTLHRTDSCHLSLTITRAAEGDLPLALVSAGSTEAVPETSLLTLKLQNLLEDTYEKAQVIPVFLQSFRTELGILYLHNLLVVI